MSHLCPAHLVDTTHNVTGLRFDYSGNSIIASYNDDDIYRMNCIDHTTPHESDGLFDSNISEEQQKGFDLRYSGHRNSDTVKQVSFLGSQSEMVVSGSDCGHIFIWETSTGKLIKVLKADSVGAVNCLSSHPNLPILASSGLESNGKLWFPMGEHKPITNGSSDSIRVQVMNTSSLLCQLFLTDHKKSMSLLQYYDCHLYRNL
jgi:WD repeat-containing protein 42A